MTADGTAPGTVAERLAAVRERVAAAARRAGREPEAVTLVVVTKSVPDDVIAAAVAAGARDLGENRAQELVAHAAALGATGHAVRWHFVGRLQSNKVRALAPRVHLWHSVDRAELVPQLARHAPGARVLVQVNVAGEATKGGCATAEAAGLVDRLRAEGLDVAGLMTVPPAVGDPAPHFAALRDLAGHLDLSELSMGMSGDFEAAIAEGATIVRVGSAVVGPRPIPGDLRS